MAIRNDAGLMLESVFLLRRRGAFSGDGGDGEAWRSRASFPSALILSDRS